MPSGITRRTFVKVGGAYIALSGTLAEMLSGSVARAAGAPGRGADTGPLNSTPDDLDSVLIDGVPFSRVWRGDRFFNDMQHPAFPALGEWIGYGNDPPAPTETADVVVVGGGLSGLAAAYLLRSRAPIVLEHNSRFGGASQGESWRGVPYSLGGAYCITTDGAIGDLYKELGILGTERVAGGPPNADPVEYLGGLTPNFWFGAIETRANAPLYRRFAEITLDILKNMYPEIPLPAKNIQWILDLDRKTFKQDIEDRLGAPAPAGLAAAIQHYCFSSFNAGWDEISAASGWNFLAAELEGEKVFPGGNTAIVRALWQRLSNEGGEDRLRTSAVALDVRPYDGDVLVTYGENAPGKGAVRSIRARRVVMACPKFVCRWIMPVYNNADPDRLNSLQLLDHRPYCVANVLLRTGMPDTLYDLFLLRDGTLPENYGTDAWTRWTRPTDVTLASFALMGTQDASVLTFYWPMPFTGGRTLQLLPDGRERIAERMLPTLDTALGVLGLRRKDVHQVRLTRWGHALPVAAPGLIADGHCQRMRAPIDGKVFFVHQDNWALPAVETCLLEALEFAPMALAGLPQKR